jgi:membrane protein DedA with SNARE-associated domain/rhodanese-related sulfurtransferase
MHEAGQLLMDQGYLALFLWVLFAQTGFPIPVVPLLLAAGALAGIGKLQVALVFGVALLPLLLGDQAWYQIGLRRGSTVLPLLCRISLDPDTCVRRTKGVFARYGPQSLLIAKFIPGMGTFAPPLAGIFRMRLVHFLVVDSLGAFIWVGVYVVLGYLFGREIEGHIRNISGTSPWLWLAIPAGLGGYLLWKYIRRRWVFHQLAIARITPEELKERLDLGEDIVIVDLRDAFEFESEPRTIPGALRFSIEELEGEHHKIPRDREIVLFCTCPNEVASARAALLLKRQGISRVRPLAGGLEAWVDRAFPLEALTPRPFPDPKSQ